MFALAKGSAFIGVVLFGLIPPSPQMGLGWLSEWVWKVSILWGLIAIATRPPTTPPEGATNGEK